MLKSTIYSKYCTLLTDISILYYLKKAQISEMMAMLFVTQLKQWPTLVSGPAVWETCITQQDTVAQLVNPFTFCGIRISEQSELKQV